MTDYYEEIRYEKYGPGKFSNNVDEWVYEQSLDGGADEELGESEGFGWYGLLQFEDPVLIIEGDKEWEFIAAIISENSQGFIEVEYFESIPESGNRWSELYEEYEQFSQPQPEEGDYIIKGVGSLGGRTGVFQYGKQLGTFREQLDAEEFIKEHMEENQFWSSVWFEDDHGGVTLIEQLGREENPSDKMVFHAKTRGGRYEIKAFKNDDGLYKIMEYKNGNNVGVSMNNPEDAAIKRLQEMIPYAAAIDGIKYKVVLDKLNYKKDLSKWGEDRGYSVGFDITIDPEHLEELGEGEEASNAWDLLLWQAKAEVEKMFGLEVRLTEGFDYGDGAEFDHWIPNLQRVADIIAEHDHTRSEGRIPLSNGLMAENFVATKGHWGRPSHVHDYEKWGEVFGIE